jgi:hypothetical protein
MAYLLGLAKKTILVITTIVKRSISPARPFDQPFAFVHFAFVHFTPLLRTVSGGGSFGVE